VLGATGDIREVQVQVAGLGPFVFAITVNKDEYISKQIHSLHLQ